MRWNCILLSNIEEQQEFGWCQSLNCSLPPYCKHLDWASSIQPKAALYTAGLWTIWPVLFSFSHKHLKQRQRLDGIWLHLLNWGIAMTKKGEFFENGFVFRTVAPYFSFSLRHKWGGQNNRNPQLLAVQYNTSNTCSVPKKKVLIQLLNSNMKQFY